MASPTPLEIAMQQRAAQQDRMLENPGALGRGFAALPGSIYNYAKNTSLPDMGREALSMGKAIGSSMLEDPGAFASDAVFAPWAALRDVSQIRAAARQARAAGDNATADKLEQYAAVSAIGGLPFAGALVKRGVGAVAKKALPLAVKRATAAAEKAPLAVERAAQPYFAPGSPERAANLARFMEGNHPDVPSVMYHATNKNDFSAFKLPRRSGTGGNAIFTSTDPDAAAYFTHGADGSRILPVHVSAKNPWDANNAEHTGGLKAFVAKNFDKLFPGAFYGPSGAARDVDAGDFGLLELPDVRRWMKKQGHDGFFTQEGEGAPRTLAIFDPRQVKSAIGNRGIFDPSEPEINKAHGGRVSSLAVKRKGKK